MATPDDMPAARSERPERPGITASREYRRALHRMAVVSAPARPDWKEALR
jgi:hypothetical protein